MKPDYHVLVGVPTMGTIHTTLASRLIMWGHLYGKSISFFFSDRVAPVDRARNQIVEKFLTQKTGSGGHFTHLLFLDSDTVPPIDAVDRLLSHDKPIVSGLTPIASYSDQEGWQTYDNCFVDRERDEEGKVIQTNVAGRHTGLVEVFRCGGSCLLIKREVFEELSKPYFEFVPDEDNLKMRTSEDIHFCDMAREAGFSIYADTEVICMHEKAILF